MTERPQTWWRKSLRRITYLRRMAGWRARTLGRRVWWALRTWSDVARRISFAMLGLGIGWAVSSIGDGVSTTSLAQYLVALGVMAGGTIAIVFAISVFLLQNSSDLYASPYLDSYIHDWREKSVYSAVIVITLCLIGAGVWVGGTTEISPTTASALAFWSLGAVGGVFGLIDWQYGNVRRKINPLRAILFLETQAVGFVSRVQQDAERMARILQSGDDTSREIALAGVYTRVLRPHFAALEGQLAKLADISVRLRERQEIGTCKRSLTASARIVHKYMEARATSSVLTPSPISLFAVDSDSSGFVARSLERFNGLAERFLRDGEEELVLHVLDLYPGLGRAAAQMRFVGPASHNPVFTQVIAYAGLLIESGTKAQNSEVVYRGMHVVGQLAQAALQQQLDTSVLSLLTQSQKAASFGMATRDLAVLNRWADVLLALLPEVFRSRVPNRRHLGDTIVEQLTDIAAMMAMMLAGGLIPSDFSWQMTAAKPVDHLPEAVRVLLSIHDETSSPEVRRTLRHDMSDLLEKLNRQWPALTEKLKSADAPLVGSVGGALWSINQLIVHTYYDAAGRFADEHQDLKRHLTWNIHLPTFFTYHADRFDGGSHAFRELVECIGKTGALFRHGRGRRPGR